jgi:hypothetical protein
VDNDVLLGGDGSPDALEHYTPDALGIGYVAAQLLAELIQGRPTPAAPVLLPP